MSQADTSELTKHADLNLTDARKILALLDWQDAGGDYFTLGSDKSIRYPIIVALEFEAKRLNQVAQNLRIAAGVGSQSGNSDPYSKTLGVAETVAEPSPDPQPELDNSRSRWGGCTVEEFSTAVKRFNQMWERMATLESNVALQTNAVHDHEQKLGKLEEFKASLVEWIKSLLNPPGSRE